MRRHRRAQTRYRRKLERGKTEKYKMRHGRVFEKTGDRKSVCGQEEHIKKHGNE
jgi:hypothetical protein